MGMGFTPAEGTEISRIFAASSRTHLQNKAADLLIRRPDPGENYGHSPPACIEALSGSHSRRDDLTGACRIQPGDHGEGFDGAVVNAIAAICAWLARKCRSRG